MECMVRSDDNVTRWGGEGECDMSTRDCHAEHVLEGDGDGDDKGECEVEIKQTRVVCLQKLTSMTKSLL